MIDIAYTAGKNYKLTRYVVCCATEKTILLAGWV